MKKFTITRQFRDFKTDQISFVRDKVISLSNSRELLGALAQYSWKLVSLCMKTKVKTVPRTKMYYRFGLYLLSLNKRHGSLYVVKYLKASQLSIQKKIAGQPFSSLREIEPDLPLPRLCRSGLPRIIGTRDRRAILSGSVNVIQLYLTLFGIYRILSAESQPKLNTISDSFTGNLSFLMSASDWFRRNSKAFLGGTWEMKDIKVNKFKFLETSSPSNSVSWKGMLTDIFALSHNKVVWSAMMKYLDITGSGLVKDFMQNSLKEMLYLGRQGVRMYTEPSKDGKVRWWDLSMKPGAQSLSEVTSIPIGQLSFKKEAAGKLRVFAMVDSWTQSILSPLHQKLFDTLRSLPNDGTFDQDASFKRCQEKAERYQVVYGYDLSSATDRLPSLLQESILTSLFGQDLGLIWNVILTRRDYVIPKNKHGLLEGVIRYAVGQPMGALTSFAMLGITHHLIMQYVSRLCGNTSKWEIRYEILGDDIVIFDHYLAAKYIEFMNSLGVPINTSKSVVSVGSNRVIEFAKRTSFKGKDCSPLSWKMILSQDTFNGRLSVVRYLADKGFMKVNRIFNIVLASKPWDVRPLKDEFSLLALVTSYAKTPALAIDDLLRFIFEEQSIAKGKKGIDFIGFKPALATRLLDKLFSKQSYKDLLPPETMKFATAFSYYEAALSVKVEKLREKLSPEFVQTNLNKITESVIPTGDKKSQSYFRPMVQNMVEMSYLTEILTVQVDRSVDISLSELKSLIARVTKLEGVIAKLLIWSREGKDRKMVTKSSLSLIDFVKKSIKDKASLDRVVLSRPMKFRKAPMNIFKGTMFETDFDFSAKITVNTKKSPTVKGPTFGGAKDKFGFDF